MKLTVSRQGLLPPAWVATAREAADLIMITIITNIIITITTTTTTTTTTITKHMMIIICLLSLVLLPTLVASAREAAEALARREAPEDIKLFGVLHKISNLRFSHFL